MSITKGSKQQPSKAPLAKAFSWHCPNRESVNPIILERQQQELEYELLRLRLRDDGDDNAKKWERRRIGMSRLNSMKSTKTNEMIQSVFRKNEQSNDQPEACIDPFRNCNARHESQTRPANQYSVPKPISRLRASRTIAKDSVKENVSGGALEEQAKMASIKRTISKSSGLSHARFEMSSAKAPSIPKQLSHEEKGMYQKLINYKQTTPSFIPARVVVITDLAKDYDDLAAMVLLKELHRLGLIKLEGFIANLHPPQERAVFGRRALDLLGLQDVPIAWGEEAEANASRRKAPNDYEFKDCDFMKNGSEFRIDIVDYDTDKPNNPGRIEIESGVRLLDKLVDRTLAEGGESPQQGLTVLALSGLADLATYMRREPEKFAAATEKVILQGAYSVEQNPSSFQPILKPDTTAANNAFDTEASTHFHAYMDNHHIPSVVWTRWAAIEAAMGTELFDQLATTNHAIGTHLQKIQSRQDLHYYDNACNGPRHLPRMNQEWFLKNKTSWYKHYPEGHPEPLPVADEVLKYVNVVTYDALAALGTAGSEVLNLLGVLEKEELLELQTSIHKVVGTESERGIDKKNMTLALSALMKGSLWASQNGFPSR